MAILWQIDIYYHFLSSNATISLDTNIAAPLGSIHPPKHSCWKVLGTVSSHLKSLNSVYLRILEVKWPIPISVRFALIFERPHLCVRESDHFFTMVTLYHPFWTFWCSVFVQESSLHLFVTSMTLYVFIFAEDKVFLLKKKKTALSCLKITTWNPWVFWR